MGVKDFFIKQVLKHKLKNVPEAQRDMMMNMVEKHPEFFKMVGDEVEKRKKSGMGETEATMKVMREHQAEFQKLMRD
ncbi:hypothetical protein KW800_00510 [Candidatus Parcubacteria bacterium]|nr:hypothetical protein [Candidatus Parcubacteria bacterium]